VRLDLGKYKAKHRPLERHRCNCQPITSVVLCSVDASAAIVVANVAGKGARHRGRVAPHGHRIRNLRRPDAKPGLTEEVQTKPPHLAGRQCPLARLRQRVDLRDHLGGITLETLILVRELHRGAKHAVDLLSHDLARALLAARR
jgi:hypothetical protein